ncbi:MAG: UDP-N-acetyl-D-glucosamine dehydrogenase [Chloroflexi bacterium]|nr:MAG: UDP-N-acetyl-D-glucosamine dehydrogenase [Anaerolineaceae bacterium 4572_32.2]RLC85857.1 MAG: UDP-N-acetyl-D-glucosamine dehydrogenase [Chloroflexota bacterium]HEY72841.1 nucleotide sugar dehydrogenase [Thermoflexia bacterium]
MSNLQDKISNRTARVAIIGLGYVGLPLATAFAQAGFRVTGVDVNQSKVDSIAAGKSYIPDVPDDELAPHIQTGRLTATSDYDELNGIDAIFICVPTPYDAQRAPDLSYIESASYGIRPRMSPGQLIVLQSTTYPGTTEEVVQPILEKSGLEAGIDFYLAFSPERIDPGNKQWSAYNTPKVVGGITPECTQLACDLLSQMGALVHPVSSARAAELTKLLENTFRAVNIALVNELALLTERMDIDFWEVVEAAKTKPFGFMPFYPGPGVGGHCIPIDPYYLSWKAREYDYYTEFIELAGEVNQAMTYHVVDLTAQALSLHKKPLRDARVLVLGVAFKPDIDDARNSPAERIIELLLTRSANVRYHDPYVPRYQVGGDVFHREPVALESVELTDEELSAADCVVIVTDHRCLDYERVRQCAQLIVDTRNVTASLPDGGAKIVRLGAPPPK